MRIRVLSLCLMTQFLFLSNMYVFFSINLLLHIESQIKFWLEFHHTSKIIQMSKVPEHGSSDDDALYSINSDFDSDDIEEVSENDESEPSSEEVDDQSNTAALE